MYFDNCKNLDEVRSKYMRFEQCVRGDPEIISEIKAEFTAKISPPPADSIAGRLEKLIKWATTRENFDMKFLLSLQEKVDKGFALSEKQVAAVDNIITKCKLKF